MIFEIVVGVIGYLFRFFSAGSGGSPLMTSLSASRGLVT